MRVYRYFLVALLLLAVLACRPPQVEAPAATAARAAAQDQPEASKADYLSGFKNGADMIQHSLEEGRKPFHLKYGQGPAVAKPQGGLPEGAQVLLEAQHPELDLATGLITVDVSGDASVPFAKGQVDGFAWALAFHRKALADQHLIQTLTAPAPPTLWTPWPAQKASLAVAGGEVTWCDGVLIWEVGRRGFPALRTWRRFGEGQRPRLLAMQAQALWVQIPGQDALALDLESGAILAVQAVRAPAAKVDDAPTDLHDYYQREKAKARIPEEQAKVAALRQRATQGDPNAMFNLAQRLVFDETEPDALAPRILWHLEAARRGNLSAMMEIAAAYYTGHGLPQDLQAARDWSQKAAATGNPAALSALATLFPETAK